MIWVMTSGGVRMDANTKKSRMAYLRLALRNGTFTIPSFARKVTKSGSSKTTPKAKRSLAEKPGIPSSMGGA